MKANRLGGFATLTTVLTLLFLVNVNLTGCSKTDHYPNRPGQKDFNDHEPHESRKGPEPESVKLDPVPYTKPDPVRDQELKIMGFIDPAVRITGNEVTFAVTVKTSDNKDVRVNMKGYIGLSQDPRYKDLYNAVMQDVRPNPEGKQSLKAFAVCLDGENCQSMFMDVYYLVNGVMRRRQFMHVVKAEAPPAASGDEEIPDHGQFDPNDPNNPYTRDPGEFVGIEPLNKSEFISDLIDNRIESLKDTINIERQKPSNVPIVNLPPSFIPELLPKMESPEPSNMAPLQPIPQQAPAEAPVAPVLRDDPFQQQKVDEAAAAQPKTEEPKVEPRKEEPPRPLVPIQRVPPTVEKPKDVSPPPAQIVAPKAPTPRRSHTPTPFEMPDGDIYPEGYTRPRVQIPNIPVKRAPQPPPQQPKQQTPPPAPVVPRPAPPEQPKSQPIIPIQPIRELPAPPKPEPRKEEPKPEPPKVETPPAPKPPIEPVKPAPQPVKPPEPVKSLPPVQQPVEIQGELAPRPQIQNPLTAIAGLPMIALNLITGGKADGFYGPTPERVDTKGRPQRIGSLIEGTEQPPEGLGFRRAMDPSAQQHRFGTGLVVDSLAESAKEFRRFRGYENNMMFYAHISTQRGGPTGHGSHQNGLDADIAYLSETPPSKLEDQTPNVTSNSGRFDYKRNFLYFAMMINTGYVHVIFVSPEIKRGFCQWAKSNNMLEAGKPVLRRLSTVAGGHHTHFHMRMKCSPHYPTCQDQRDFFGPDNQTSCEVFGIK